jgi:hypothetical protein
MTQVPCLGCSLKHSNYNIVDENIFLPDWLAYHDTMLPLRYLVVANDPHSQTLPLEIMEQWSHTNLQYIIWEDSNFLTNQLAKATQTMAKNNKGSINATRTRQLVSFRENQFMYRCNQHFKTMNLNQSWVPHNIHRDEFIMFNRTTNRTRLLGRLQGRCPGHSSLKNISQCHLERGNANRKIIMSSPRSDSSSSRGGQ